MTNKLSEEEICGFVKDMLSVSISKDQLMNPTKELVVNVYARFLSEFGIENVGQPDIMAFSGVDNIEAFETNIILWNITKSVASIVQNAGVPDMCLADSSQPKRNRNIRILSALCMLYYKLTEIESKFSQNQSKYADLPDKRKAIEQRNRALKKTIDEKAMYLSSNKPKAQGLAQELKSSAEALEKKKSEAELLQEETRQLKTLILSRKEKISELEVELSRCKEDIHELEDKIVKSPERIQADTSNKEQELESKRNEKKKIEKEYMELMRNVDFLREASNALTPSLESFTEAFKEIETMKSQCELLCQTKLTASKKEEQIKTLKVQLKEKEKTIQTIKTQIVNNEKQFQQQIQTFRQINNGLKRDLKQKTETKTEEDRSLVEETIRLKNRLNELDVEYKSLKEQFILVMKLHSERMTEIQQYINTRLKQIKQLKEKSNKK